MIAKTDAQRLLAKNLQRTEMLIAAMEKIKAYNSIYQMNQTNPQDYQMIKAIQDKQLTQIEQACGEHAIISLVTAFETYYKEMVQQLLSAHPGYFTAVHTEYSDKVLELLKDGKLFTYEDIERKLHLGNRFSYYDFFKAYSIAFLSADEEKLIEYLFLRRHNYVHNAGRPDTKLKNKLAQNPSPFKEDAVSTEAKRLRTRMNKILLKSYDRVITNMTHK